MISASQPPGSPAINALVKGNKNIHHLAIRAHRLPLFCPLHIVPSVGFKLELLSNSCLSCSISHWPEAQMPSPRACRNLQWVTIQGSSGPLCAEAEPSPCLFTENRLQIHPITCFCSRSCFWPQKGLERDDQINSFSLDGSSGCQRFRLFFFFF